MDKRKIKVIKIISILIAFTFYCGNWNDKLLFEVKVDGCQFITKKEIFEMVDWHPDKPDPNKNWRIWKPILEKNTRIISANMNYKRGVLEIFIEERIPVGIVQLGDKAYEFDNEFRIISINDIRGMNVPVLTGDFRLKKDRQLLENLESLGDEEIKISGARFDSLWKQSHILLKESPEVWKRLSEIELSKEGDIYLYFHQPKNLTVNIGTFISKTKTLKLYSSIGFIEKDALGVRYLDLRGEDGFYY